MLEVLEAIGVGVWIVVVCVAVSSVLYSMFCSLKKDWITPLMFIAAIVVILMVFYGIGMGVLAVIR